MQVNHSSLSFGSNYKFNINKNNYEQANEAADKLYMMEMLSGFTIFDKFTPAQQAFKTGIFQNITVAADDKFDNRIETILKNNGIDFRKTASQELLDLDNIQSRIKLSEWHKSKDFNLVKLDTKKFDEYFQKDSQNYIEPNGVNGLGSRYEDFKTYLKTGQDIDASAINLSERNGELHISFNDGRHRYAVMRDMGMKSIPFSLDNDSLELAKKYDLVSE